MENMQNKLLKQQANENSSDEEKGEKQVKKALIKDARVSTMVCTHPGFMEDFNMQMSPLFPAFTPKAEVKGYPFIGYMLDANQSFYIPRAGTPEER